MTVQIHRSERADALVRGLAGLLATSPGRPVRRPTSSRCRPRASSGGSRSGCPRARRTGDAADGICANVLFPSPGAAGVRGAVGGQPASTPTTTRGSSTGWLGRCSTSIDACAASPGAARWAGTSVCVDGGQDGGRRVAAAQQAGRAVRPGTAPSAPRCCGTWAAGDDTDGAGDAAGRRPRGGRPSCGGGSATSSATPSPAERLDAACAAAARPSPSRVDLPAAAVGVRADPADPDAAAGARRAGRAPGRAPVAAAPLARAVGPGRARPTRR